MAVYPTDKGSPGTWGAECRAYHAVSTDLDTGKIKDGAVQVSSAAPTVDAGVANKKYVDDNIGSANFTPTSYTGGESVTLPNGMIMKTGFKAESSNPHTVTFATPFPNACVWANATARDTSAITEQNTNIDAAPTTTQLKININSSSDGAYWIAIGY